MTRMTNFVAAAWLLGSGVAQAGSDIDQLQNIVQGQFRLLSEDVAAAFSYKPLAPATPLGLTGFDVGIALTGTALENEGILEAVTSGDAPSMLLVPKVQMIKGLPLGIDIGGSYVGVPGTKIRLWGAEIRWAILDGGIATPAIGLRGSVTRLDGVDQLDFGTRALDVAISKGFAVATPYAGVGRVWATSTPLNVPGLSEEKFSMTKVFAGVGLKFLLLNLDFEVDKTGDAKSYGAKIGVRF